MSLEAYPNPPLLVLQISLLDFEGKAKENVVSAQVRVFHVHADGSEVNDLAPTPLVRIGTSPAWRYVWVTPPLPDPGGFIIEYTAVDDDGIQLVEPEDLLILDPDLDPSILAQLVAMSGQMDTVLDCHLGRQKLSASSYEWTLYRRDGTILKTFKTYDDVGNPGVEDIFDRRPV